MLRNSQDHMHKIRKRKLNHLFTNVPLTIPQIFQSSHRVNIQLDNKQVFYEKKLHLNERNYNTHRIRQNLPTVSNSKCPQLNNLNNKLCQCKTWRLVLLRLSTWKMSRIMTSNVGTQWELHRPLNETYGNYFIYKLSAAIAIQREMP